MEGSGSGAGSVLVTNGSGCGSGSPTLVSGLPLFIFVNSIVTKADPFGSGSETLIQPMIRISCTCSWRRLPCPGLSPAGRAGCWAGRSAPEIPPLRPDPSPPSADLLLTRNLIKLLEYDCSPVVYNLHSFKRVGRCAKGAKDFGQCAVFLASTLK